MQLIESLLLFPDTLFAVPTLLQALISDDPHRIF